MLDYLRGKETHKLVCLEFIIFPIGISPVGFRVNQILISIQKKKQTKMPENLG